MPDANYGVLSTAFDDEKTNDRNILISQVTVTSFQVFIAQGDNGGGDDTPVDCEHTVAVLSETPFFQTPAYLSLVEGLTPVMANGVPTQSFFVDGTTQELKWRNAAGEVFIIPLVP